MIDVDNQPWWCQNMPVKKSMAEASKPLAAALAAGKPKFDFSGPPQLIDCEQGSDEWFAARLGIPTSSEFACVISQPGPRGGEPKGRRTYMLKLIGERFTQKPKYDYFNDHMQRGKDMEDEARQWYQIVHDIEVTRAGFVRRGEAGCSPDSFIDKEGLLEIKTKLPHLLLECLLDGRLPPEHKAQVQGQLWITKRKWCDFVCYWPDMPEFCVRVYRDEPYIQEIERGVCQFLTEMQDLIERLRGVVQ